MKKERWSYDAFLYKEFICLNLARPLCGGTLIANAKLSGVLFINVIGLRKKINTSNKNASIRLLINWSIQFSNSVCYKNNYYTRSFFFFRINKVINSVCAVGIGKMKSLLNFYQSSKVQLISRSPKFTISADVINFYTWN